MRVQPLFALANSWKVCAVIHWQAANHSRNPGDTMLALLHVFAHQHTLQRGGPVEADGSKTVTAPSVMVTGLQTVFTQP